MIPSFASSSAVPSPYNTMMSSHANLAGTASVAPSSYTGPVPPTNSYGGTVPSSQPGMPQGIPPYSQPGITAYQPGVPPASSGIHLPGPPPPAAGPMPGVPPSSTHGMQMQNGQMPQPAPPPGHPAYGSGYPGPRAPNPNSQPLAQPQKKLDPDQMPSPVSVVVGFIVQL